MKKLILAFILTVATLSLSALDSNDVARLIYDAGNELGYNLKIMSGSRSWEEQADTMISLDEEKAQSMYGFSDEVWNGLLSYKNGKISRDEFIVILKKYKSRFKHVGGNANDIGVNSSGLNREETAKLIKKLKEKGLSVLDETRWNQPCLHVYQE